MCCSGRQLFCGGRLAMSDNVREFLVLLGGALIGWGLRRIYNAIRAAMKKEASK